jgi:hypothetical protein
MLAFEEVVDALDDERQAASDDPLIVEAQESLAALYDPRGSQDWQSWIKVGAALKQGRDACIRTAGANGPFGEKYKTAFKRWLEETRFAERPDTALRSKLIEVMENLPLIEEWRENHLTDRERARLNNPDSVLPEMASRWARHAKPGALPRPPKSAIHGPLYRFGARSLQGILAGLTREARKGSPPSGKRGGCPLPMVGPWLEGHNHRQCPNATRALSAVGKKK